MIFLPPFSLRRSKVRGGTAHHEQSNRITSNDEADKTERGLLGFRKNGEALEVFLVHPGGPYWAKKDEGAWTLLKGEYKDGEEARAAAQREFKEETASPLLVLSWNWVQSVRRAARWS